MLRVAWPSNRETGMVLQDKKPNFHQGAWVGDRSVVRLYNGALEDVKLDESVGGTPGTGEALHDM